MLRRDIQILLQVCDVEAPLGLEPLTRSASVTRVRMGAASPRSASIAATTSSRFFAIASGGLAPLLASLYTSIAESSMLVFNRIDSLLLASSSLCASPLRRGSR